MTEHEVRVLIRQHIRRAGSARALADLWSISQSNLSKQARGAQPIGAKVLANLRLVRRKTHLFHAITSKGLQELVHEAAECVADHDRWREEQGIRQREAGHGTILRADEVARMFGIIADDLLMIARAGIGFPAPDAGPAAWKPSTIYGWLRHKARRIEARKRI